MEEKEGFWFDGFFCKKIGNEEVSIGHNKVGIFNKLTFYGESDPVKHFEKNVVIPKYALDQTTNKKYKITEITPSCFDYGRNIETLSMPDSVLNMKWCFWKCSNLKEIHFDGNNTKYCDVQGVVYSKDKHILFFFPPAYDAEEYRILLETREIYRLAFKTARRIKKLFIPDSVQVIGTNVFYDCPALEHVYIEGKLRKFDGNTQGEFYPKDTVFHYQGKEMSSKELQKEVNKK